MIISQAQSPLRFELEAGFEKSGRGARTPNQLPWPARRLWMEKKVTIKNEKKSKTKMFTKEKASTNTI